MLKFYSTISRVTLCSVLAGLVTACASSTMTLSPTGPVVKGATAGPARTFEDAEAASRGDRPNADHARDMFLQGSALIYANCDAFFNKASDRQAALIFARDATGAFTAISSSVLALTRANKTALAVLGIGGTTAYTSIDLVTKDYLFASDNVEAVRSLTSNALSTHTAAVLAVARTRSFTYDFAAKQLFDEQAICTMRSIAALARDAIANGHLVATTNTPDGDLVKLAQLQDAYVLQNLGVVYDAHRPLSADEAGALWWYLQGNPDQASKKAIFAKLSALPAAKLPVDVAGADVPGWSLGATTLQLLLSFSSATITDLTTQIPTPGGRAKQLDGSAQPVIFTLAASAAQSGGDHIQVRAK